MDGIYNNGRKRGLEEDGGGDINKRQHRDRGTGSHVHQDEDYHQAARHLDSDQQGRPFADQSWGGPNRGRGRSGWQEGRGRGYMPNGMTVPRQFMAPGRGHMHQDRGGRWAGRGGALEVGASMPEGAAMHGGHFVLPLPPQHEDSREERGMPGPPGPMQEDGFQGQFGRGQGAFPGRGRGWGRGAPGGGFRRQGGPPLDPAVLERRRQSTAASVQRQLAHVLVSEDLAGDKGFTHYQRAVSIASTEQEPANGNALWAEDRVKQCYMASGLPSVDNHAGSCDYDALDAFELCLNEYQAIPLEVVSLEASKYGSFLAPRLLFGGLQVKRE